MDRLRQDIHYAFRTLLRSPLFTITVVATLGLGIGANTAIFSFVDAMLLRVLPYPDPDRLVVVWQDYSSTGGPDQEWFTPPDYADLAEQSRSLEAVTALVGWNPNLTGVQEAERLVGTVVSADWFRVAGVVPAVGRPFDEGDVEGGATNVVVLSDGLWKRAFGGRPDIVGATIQLNGTPYTVVGVMPPDFEPPFMNAEIWRPYDRTFFSAGCGRACYVMQVLGRLRGDVSLDQAATDMERIGRGIRDAAPGEKAGLVLRLVPLHEQLAGPVQPALIALLGAVGLLLLIACVNVANLLIARASGREREIAVRAAIGASRIRLLRQLLTESLVVGAAGGALGILLAFWGVDVLVAMSPPVAPRLAEVAVDGRALGFAAGLSLLTGILFGLVPAMQLSGLQLTASMKEPGARAGARSRRHTRSVLVATEIAIALTLLAGAGLMVRSLIRLQSVDPGFRPERAAALQLLLPIAGYPETSQATQFFDRVIERVSQQPPVQAAGAVSILPLTGDNTDVSFLIEGRPQPLSREQMPVADYRSATSGYLEAVGMRLLRGRWITAADRADAPEVIVVNETMARRYWPNQDAIGRRISYRGPEGPWSTVVGIVADVRDRGLDQPVRPEMFMSWLQQPSRQMSLVMRTGADPVPQLAAARALIRAMDPDLPVAAQTTLDDMVTDSVAMPRLFAAFFGFFALVALLLAAIGVYGVTAQAVSQRAQEIGIRIALGADRSRVLGLIVGQAMAVSLAGLGIGVVLALALSRALESLLFELSPADPVTFLAITALLAAVSLTASWVPARRAAVLDPMKTLRAE